MVATQDGALRARRRHRRRCRFTFTPDQTGRFVYTVTVPVFPDEAVAENNTRSFALKVIRDRVRVLLVAGRPTWDERFLRGLLRQDANVELISFYILRSNADDRACYDERELSLIPFPRDEIFREKIDTFDVVIFLNFGYDGQWLSTRRLRARHRALRAQRRRARHARRRSHASARRATRSTRSPRRCRSRRAGPADLAALQAAPHARRRCATRSPRWAPAARSHRRRVGRAAGHSRHEPHAAPSPARRCCSSTPSSPWTGKNAPLLALWEYGRGRVAGAGHRRQLVLGLHRRTPTGAPSRAYERFWSNAHPLAGARPRSDHALQSPPTRPAWSRASRWAWWSSRARPTTSPTPDAERRRAS